MHYLLSQAPVQTAAILVLSVIYEWSNGAKKFTEILSSSRRVFNNRIKTRLQKWKQKMDIFTGIFT